MKHHRHVRRPRRAIVASLLTITVVGGCKPLPPPPEPAPALRSAVAPEAPAKFTAVNDPDLVKLKEALRVGTAEALIPYFEHPDVMAPGGRLTPHDAAYLRGESQGGIGPLKPVRDILKEPVAVLATRQEPGDEWIVVFIPESKRGSLKSAAFLETGWMTDYFACWVDRRDGKVRIIQNFCFNETDGPYPGDD